MFKSCLVQKLEYVGWREQVRIGYAIKEYIVNWSLLYKQNTAEAAWNPGSTN